MLPTKCTLRVAVTAFFLLLGEVHVAVVDLGHYIWLSPG